MEILLGIIAIVEAVVIVVLFLYFMRDKRQLQEFIKQAQEIKKRRIDLDDIDVSDKKKDQVILADAINAIKNNMQTFLEATKCNVVVLSDAIEELTNGARQNEDGSTKISESLSEVVSKIEEQSELVASCLNLIEDNTMALTEIDGSVKNIGSLLHESVNSCKSGVDSLEKYESNMKSISENLARSEKILVDFSNKITEINEIGSFIVDISESLKLLALNASIEAARVGAAGIGFTVVAKEMGVMSEKTQEGIGTINSILENIIDSSAQVNDCIRECVEVFGVSRKEFDAVSASFRTIDSQSQVINGKMQDILGKIDRITNNSQVTRERADQAYQASATITAGTQEISQISVLTSENSKKISEHVNALDSMLVNIQTLLKQFTTSVEPVPAKPGKHIKIGVLCILDNDFWYSVRRGIIYAQKELEAYNCEVRYMPYTSWGLVQENMVNDVNSMIKENFDGFIYPGFMAGARLEIQHAHDMGKKVFVFNCDNPEEFDREACFQPDVQEAGMIAGRAMEKALNKSGKVVILEGDHGVPVNKMRSEGFKQYLEKSKGIKIVESIFVEEGEEDTYKKAMEAIKKYPDLDGIYITIGYPIAAAKAIEDSGKKISLVVFDHSDEIFSYIKKGIISAAIGQDAFGQGHDPIVWMYNSLMSDVKLPSDIMKCRANVVDQDNVDSLIGAGT